MDWVTIIAERRIQEAIDAGDPDTLPGKGKPIHIPSFPGDRGEWIFMTVIKNAGVLPREVELMKQAAELREAIERNPDSPKTVSSRADLAATETELDIRLGRAKTRRLPPHATGKLPSGAALRSFKPCRS